MSIAIHFTGGCAVGPLRFRPGILLPEGQGDYRAANSQIVKIVPNLPSDLEEVEKAAGHQYYWESDSVACYSQFTLAPGRSREALAIWTPIGLVQPTTVRLRARPRRHAGPAIALVRRFAGRSRFGSFGSVCRSTSRTPEATSHLPRRGKDSRVW